MVIWCAEWHCLPLVVYVVGQSTTLQEYTQLLCSGNIFFLTAMIFYWVNVKYHYYNLVSHTMYKTLNEKRCLYLDMV